MSKKYTPKNCLFKDEHSKESFPNTDGECFCCGLKIGKTFKEKLADKVAAIPVEMKQKFLDGLKTMNVGDARKYADPNEEHEFIAWVNFLGNQIDTFEYLDYKVKQTP